MDISWLREEAARLLAQNRVEVTRNWNGPQRAIYHAPSLPPPNPSPLWPRWRHNLFLPFQVAYPHQWFWDSLAHAIVLSHLDLGLAKEEIRSLLYAQREDGFIPHLIWTPPYMHWADRLLQRLYSSPHFSPYLQPPLLAQAVEAIAQKEQDTSFLRQCLPHLQRYYLFLDQARNRSGDGLLELIHSYESGKDRSREYDPIYGEENTQPAWRGPLGRLMLKHRLLGWNIDRILASQAFRVKDLLFNCVYAQNLRVLSRLLEKASLDGLPFRQKAIQVETSILSKMYDPQSGLFLSLDARWGRDSPLPIPTASSFLPLLLETIPLDTVDNLVKHLREQFWAPYPVPQEPLSQSVESHIWRGPQTWIYVNWFLVQGLRKQARRFPQREREYRAIAQEITLKSYELVKKSGFREYYDAGTGEGKRACNFGWSTLVLDMMYNN